MIKKTSSTHKAKVKKLSQTALLDHDITKQMNF